MAKLMDVQVCYATPTEVYLIDLSVPTEASLLEVVQKSQILSKCPEIDLQHHKLGIFGKIKLPDAGLHAGDRIEIYRPLVVDPKEARRRRAQKNAKS